MDKVEDSFRHWDWPTDVPTKPIKCQSFVSAVLASKLENNGTVNHFMEQSTAQYHSLKLCLVILLKLIGGRQGLEWVKNKISMGGLWWGCIFFYNNTVKTLSFFKLKWISNTLHKLKPHKCKDKLISKIKTKLSQPFAPSKGHHQGPNCIL